LRPVVVDTSVLLKLFLAESGAEGPEALFRARAEGELQFAAPEFGLLECANVLWKQERRGGLSSAEVDLILEQLVELRIVWAAASPLLAPGLALARRTGQGVYDGAFLALAERLGAVFVTADERLVEACRGRVASVVPLSRAVDELGL
jgi:predicted nucleic acid-binding protein